MKYYFNRFMEYANIKGEKNVVELLYLGIVYIYCYMRYRATIRNFFTYKFYLLNHSGRKMFLSNGNMMKYYKKNNNPSYADVLRSKEETFRLYSQYMKREWCGVNYNNSIEQYQHFLNTHSKGILKPNRENGGFGIKIIEFSGRETAQYWMKYCVENQMIMEELIIQHSELNLLYEKSINTIRVVTHLGEVVGAVIRIGAHGSEIDNVSSGGMCASIDIDTGIVISKATSYKLEQYVVHPDTGCVILGKQIPMWNEILDLVKEATNIVTNIPIIGWDIAVTPEGPVIVEVNEEPGFSILQQHRLIELGETLVLDEN